MESGKRPRSPKLESPKSWPESASECSDLDEHRCRDEGKAGLVWNIKPRLGRIKWCPLFVHSRVL